jgi:hypothetical protein
MKLYKHKFLFKGEYQCYEIEVEEKPKTYYINHSRIPVKKSMLDKLDDRCFGCYRMYSLSLKREEFKKLVIEELKRKAELARVRYDDANNLLKLANNNDYSYVELDEAE